MNEFNPAGSGSQVYLWLINAGFSAFFTALGIPWASLIITFIEDFVSFFAQFFSGRPAVGLDSATDDVALFLIPSANPIITLWGLGIRGLEAHGIPLSTSNAAQRALYEEVATAARNDLIRQFGATAGAEYFTQYGYLTSLKNPDSNTTALNARQLVDKHYTDAVTQGKIDPKTGFPYPTGTGPQPVSTTCTDPCQLELQSILTSQMAPALNSIGAALQKIGGALESGTDPNLAAHMQEIASSIVDLQTCVCADFNAFVNVLFPTMTKAVEGMQATGNTFVDVLFPELIKAVQNIQFSGGGGGGWPAEALTLLQSIAQALAKSAAGIDPPPPGFWDTIVRRGNVDPAVGQLVTAWPFQEIITALTSVSRNLGGELGNVEAGIGALAQNIILPWARRLLQVVEGEADTFLAAAQAQAGPWAGKIANAFKAVVAALGGAESDVPRVVFDAVAALATSGEAITADNVEDITFKMMGISFLVGQGIHLLAGVASYLGYPMSSVWGHNATMMVDLLSFDEIRESVHNPFWIAAIRRRATQHYNSVYRTEVPGYQHALQLWARRKLTTADRDNLLAANGLDTAYVAPEAAGAYRPLSAFLLRSGFRNRDIPAAIENAIFEDQALAPQFFPFMSDLLQSLAYDQIENQYVTALEQGYAKGAVSLGDLNAAMANLGWGQRAVTTVQKRAVLLQQTQLIEMVLKMYTPEVEDGLVPASTMQQALESAGAQPWWAEQQANVAQAKAAVRGFVKAESVARHTVDQQWTAEVRAITAQYAKGHMNAAQATAALGLAYQTYLGDLAAAGVPPDQLAPLTAAGPTLIAAIVAAAQARQALNEVLVFGLTLPKDKAELLQEEVAALEEQFAGALIDAPTLMAALLGLGIPKANAQALVARKAAGTLKRHSGSELLPP